MKEMIHKSIFILGRQPTLGKAELESLFGPERLEPVGDHAMASDVPAEEVLFGRLGGSVRLAKPLTTIDTTEWRGVIRRIADQLPSLLAAVPEGKIKLGVSAFGLRASAKQLVAAGLELKKACKNTGRSSVRVVPNTEPELSSAQIIHNQLTGQLGVELLLIRHGRQTYLAQTAAVQDIEAYARRDQNRPKRDARVGMLPPKLAQIIVNLAVGKTDPKSGSVVYDPFCGTGVILQEASLMGFDIAGSDIDPRMIAYTKENLRWLLGRHGSNVTPHGEDEHNFNLKTADATSSKFNSRISAVATETYLGRPLNHWPPAETLQEIIDTCNVVIKKFLRNIYEQIQPGTRLCLAVPQWRSPNGQNHRLPFLDHLGEMDYNRVSFEHTEAQELVYFRPNQIVARELLVITRK